MIETWNSVLERLLDRLESEGVPCSYSTEDNPVLTEYQFPHLSVVESDNYTYRRTITRRGEEHAGKMYTINVYSNSANGRRTEAENISAIVDSEMLAMGFTRISMIPMSNLHNATVYRITARYTGAVSKDGIVYRI